LDVTDYELVKTCLSGQQHAFSEIVARYKKLVNNIIYNLNGGTSEASDLSQEVFLRIYKSLHRYNPDFRFATWVIKITTNVCLDLLRRKKHEPEPVEYHPEAFDSRSNPEEHYMEKEELRRIRQAIRELPEKYRTPVVLFHQQGLSYKELEEVLNQPETIIKNRLYRARLMLRDRLCSEGEVL
jgi:RNA polymerase sigma factor (sigma-70 family)